MHLWGICLILVSLLYARFELLLVNSNPWCILFIQKPIILQGWLLYTELIQFSVQLHIQSLLWVILHVQLIIVVSVIVLSLGSISTWYQIHFRSISLLQIRFAGSTLVTGSLLLTAGTIFELWINIRRSSWLLSISLNGKKRWRYFGEKKASTGWLWQ